MNESSPGPGVPARSASVSLLLDPVGQARVFHAVQGGESRTARAAGLIGLEQRGPLFVEETQPPAAVGLHDGVVRSSHRWLRYLGGEHGFAGGLLSSGWRGAERLSSTARGIATDSTSSFDKARSPMKSNRH